MTATRVIIGEDSYLVREGLVNALARDERVEVVGAAGDLDALRDLVDRLHPDVLITDIRMPPTGTDEGIALAGELARTHPDVGVIVLSEHAQVSYALTLFAQGASRRAYLLKERVTEPEYLVGAIEAIAGGRPMLDSKIVGLIVDARQESGSRLDELTERERTVLGLIAAGRSNSAIAGELVVTRRAVERHVASIFAKLELAESEAVNRRVVAALLFMRSAD